MIKPEEMRVGNYVELYGNIATIQRADFNGVGIAIDEGEPIKLTEQWLKDFGAAPVGSTYTLEIDSLSRLSIYPVKDKFLFELQSLNPKDGSDFTDAFVSLKMYDYVHSFQNLFNSLTGKELTKQ